MAQLATLKRFADIKRKGQTSPTLGQLSYPGGTVKATRGRRGGQLATSFTPEFGGEKVRTSQLSYPIRAKQEERRKQKEKNNTSLN